MLEPTKEDLLERYEQMTDEEFESLQPINLTQVALEAYKAVLEHRNKSEYQKLLQKEDKDRRENETRKTGGVENNSNQSSSEKSGSPSSSNFMSVAFGTPMIIVILIVLRVSLAWPFGPDGIICTYINPYANTTVEYKFWNTLGGCTKVVRR